ncbi:anti-sigma regulatory factor [Streptomyces sp. RS10V-4]|uniref:anti-sigma regulatory factor n=1 Tax=Streptomyces rhizoryzae TaxID=2932493 RepID=UPI00200489BF|nr:anti-sigma regulatory factor [Streptomyces rhizoryzae]MCK7624450.1 anti-sigma regulatory factor [Streptomyces rhizoryzae]
MTQASDVGTAARGGAHVYEEGCPTTPTVHEVRSEEDLLAVRHAVRAATLRAGFSIVDQTRVVTAASELARNAYVHGGGGTVTIEFPDRNGTPGLRLTVRDDGPGIPDLSAALTDGFTTGAGLGHGLGGARRLMDEFEIDTAAGQGTTVTVTRWAVR